MADDAYFILFILNIGRLAAGQARFQYLDTLYLTLDAKLSKVKPATAVKEQIMLTISQGFQECITDCEIKHMVDNLCCFI